MRKKLFLLLCCLLIIISSLIFVSCKAKKVELIFWMLGNPPKDIELINEELNKLTLKDLNCTVKINMTTWTDWANKYKLLLSSGQPIDLIFTADWVDYNQYAEKGAYKALDDLVPKYAPKLNKFVPKEMWDAVRINGNIYTIPATWKEYVEEGICYREDLRKKHNLPVPDSLENIEAYLEGIKKNETDIIPTSSEIYQMRHGTEFTLFMSLRQLLYKHVDKNGLAYGLVADYDNPTEVRSYWGSEDMLKDMKTMKRWADKGFWSRSVLSQQVTPKDMITEGSIAADLGINPVKYTDIIQRAKAGHPDWEFAYIPYCRITKLVRPVHPTHNGFAVPISSKNTERALKFYEKLVLDKRYNWLTEYGIEGKHFEVVDNKYYKMIGTAEENGFQRESLCGWAWRNPEYQIFDKSFDVVLELFEEMDQYSKPDIFSSFVENYTPYQAERAAIYQITAQYLVPMQAGLVDDVDKAMKQFMDKIKAAGLENVQNGYKEQWLKYCEEHGL